MADGEVVMRWRKLQSLALVQDIPIDPKVAVYPGRIVRIKAIFARRIESNTRNN